MTRRRNEIDIIVDILRIAQNGGARKTRIVYGANLNFQVVDRYLQRLIGNGLLILEDPHYVATEKGDRLIERYNELMAVLGSAILEEKCRTGS